MRLNYLPSGRAVVVPETDLEERIVVARMTALARDGDKAEIAGATYQDKGLFATYSPDWFLYLEHFGDGRFELLRYDD